MKDKLKGLGAIIVFVTICTLVATYALSGPDMTIPNRDGEQLIEVDTFVIHYYCDLKDCTGEYGCITKTMDKDKKAFQHQCTKCKQIRFLPAIYPNIVYKEKKQ